MTVKTHLYLSLLLFLTACAAPLPTLTATVTPLPLPSATATLFPPTRTATPSPSPTKPPSPTPTPTLPPLLKPGSPLPQSLQPISLANASIVFGLAEIKEDAATDIAWTADGTVLAVAATDQIHLYAVRTREKLRSLSTKKGITAITFSPDGRFLASGQVSGSEDQGYLGSISLWRGPDWQPMGIFLEDIYPIASVRFSPGDIFAAAFVSRDEAENKVISWNTASWEIIRIFRAGLVLDLAFSPNGELLATTPDRYAVKIWQMKDGKRLHNLNTSFGGAVNSLAFSPDGKTLATGHYDGLIRLWDVGKGEPVAEFKAAGVVECLAFSPDGSILASGESYFDNKVRLWDVASGQVLRTLEGHPRGVNDLAFSPDGLLLASVSYDGTVRLWGVAP